jgi:hypothetical protein
VSRRRLHQPAPDDDASATAAIAAAASRATPADMVGVSVAARTCPTSGPTSAASAARAPGRLLRTSTKPSEARSISRVRFARRGRDQSTYASRPLASRTKRPRLLERHVGDDDARNTGARVARANAHAETEYRVDVTHHQRYLDVAESRRRFNATWSRAEDQPTPQIRGRRRWVGKRNADFDTSPRRRRSAPNPRGASWYPA